MKLALITPNNSTQKSDMFTTSSVQMPVGLAYFAAALRADGHEVKVIDSFGEAPNQWWEDKEFVYRGLTPSEVTGRLGSNTFLAIIYANNVTHHRSVLDLIVKLKQEFPARPVAVMENSQWVTSYSLRRVQEEFYSHGADFVITGDPEGAGLRLVTALEHNDSVEKLMQIQGIGVKLFNGYHYSEPGKDSVRLDGIPFAAWDLFPIKNYWDLRYAHGPQSNKRYLPLLTSRGCPYQCKFCVIPETNDKKWRSRTAAHVVGEMEHLQKQYSINEFHFEDPDPTVSDKRIREICEQIIVKNLKFSWKLAGGTKVETIKNEETIALMARAGCRFIAISPESGSERVLQLMHKSFDFDHALRLISKMKECGIYSQTCFVLGFPGEEDADRLKTERLIHELAKAGADEIAIMITTPLPGSGLFGAIESASDYTRLTFSPQWRADYKELNKFRLRLYRKFIIWKFAYHPFRFAKQPLNFLTRRFNSKMEMVPYRALHTLLLRMGFIGKKVIST